MSSDWIKKRMRSISLPLALPLALGVTAASADVLDGIVFGVKCLGAADRQACEEQSTREADEMRDRLRQESQTRSSSGAARANSPPEDTLGKRIYRNWRENVVCHDYAKRTGRDIDSTYARVMSRYSFARPAEARRQSGTGEWGLHLAGYLHEAVPGALYRLEQVVHSPDVARGKRQYKLILDLARDGSGTRVTGQYCVTTDDPAGWQDLPPQVLASLNNTF